MPTQKMPIIFICESCDFTCSKKSNWDKHLLTRKHEILQNPTLKNATAYICDCGKNYKHSSSYYTHKNKCNLEEKSIITKVTPDEEFKLLTTLVLDVVKSNNDLHKQNQEFKDLLIEQNKQSNEMQKNVIEICKNGTTNLINNNSHNKTFNLQFFLNEKCKDAMNIMDFVDSLQLQLSDLESVGKLGFVEGISDIIVKNLKALDIEKRPVHCTDSKREVMYVKDQDIWYNDSKEDKENKKLKKAIKRIANKNAKLLSEFKAKYPDCIYSDSTKSDQYNKIIIESFGGSNENEDNENKIIKKIAKEITISKDLF